MIIQKKNSPLQIGVLGCVHAKRVRRLLDVENVGLCVEFELFYRKNHNCILFNKVLYKASKRKRRRYHFKQELRKWESFLSFIQVLIQNYEE